MTCERAGCRTEGEIEVKCILGVCELCVDCWRLLELPGPWPAWLARIFARRREAIAAEHRA